MIFAFYFSYDGAYFYEGRRFTLLLRYIKSTDKLLLGLCLAASVLSAVALASLGQEVLPVNYRRTMVQMGAALIGIASAILLSTMDYEALAKAWPIHALLTWGAVAATFFIGYAPVGTTNKAWIALPAGLSLQPTELAKLSFVLTFALHLSGLEERINDPGHLWKVLLHMGAPLALIMAQGDDGTMIIFGLIALTMVFAAGIDYKYIGFAAGAGLLAAPLAWRFYLGKYQKDRILALFDPDRFPAVMWQQTQGKISIGAGQMFGKGFFGVEHHNVPLAYNDFIFAYISESLGFLGSMLVLFLLFGIGARALHTARRSQDNLGYFICVGIFAIFFWQTVINIGMNLSVLPVIGITLPLFSAGGTSVVASYFAVGLALSVYLHSRRTLFDSY